MTNFEKYKEGGSCSEIPNNSDCISRQAAIDETKKCRFVVDAIEKIRGLPSAQPEIILCKDCEYSDFAGLNNKRLYCMKHSSYFYEDDFCSYAMRREDE